MSDSQYDTGVGPLMAKVLEQQREIARLTAERDEARRMYCRCRMDLEGVPMGELNAKGAEYASRRGWDCFKEDGK